METISDTVFTSLQVTNHVLDSLNTGSGKGAEALLSGNVYSGSSLLGHRSIDINIHQILPSSGNWIFYVLFGMLALLAIVRYYYPMPLVKLLSFSSPVSFTRSKEDNKGTSGILVPFFLFLNAIIALGMLFIALLKIYSIEVPNYSLAWLFIILTGSVLGFYFLRQLLVLSAGFLFDTRKAASRHVQAATTIVYFSGLIINPLMLLYFYTQVQWFVYLTVSVLAILWIIKLFNVIKIGMTMRKFKPLHIFLYLCTVEFLPLLLLIKIGIEQLRVI